MSDTAGPVRAVSLPEPRGSQVAIALVVAALVFNLALSFINASVFRVSASHVIGIELVIVGIAGAMVATRSANLYAITIALFAWLVFAMAARANFDPKIFRDALIPVIFFLLGRHFGSLAAGDRAVTISLLIVTAGALLEWFFLDLFLKYFDVLSFYRAKGAVDASFGGDGPGLYISGLRFDGRTLLPFLGEHRVSSVFLEPVSLGNFGAIAFAWVLLRDGKRPAALILKMLLIATVLILGDSRFGVYLCVIVALIYAVAPLARPLTVFVMPFIALILLLIYAWHKAGMPWDNTTSGRILASGQLLTTLDLSQALGLKTTVVDFGDSGYAYVLSQFGLFGALMLWSIYVFGCPAETMQSWRFKLFTCMYLVLLLSISTSSMTIKTGALLWFLAGCAAQGTRMAPGAMHPAALSAILTNAFRSPRRAGLRR
ncbi:surface polysaccharide polymerase [Enterovirga rhinocerotis]|uniref:Putative polymerase n=1 Tax=Enterovirga rhinocerotis TaxID=1339210 RepID=A0A4R7CAF3_9HYPH|nr:surface polysaccharide polymerase [Enterovirga rhinocerotis]TDR95042.1 putative polymerase [Enterovirga rhinocerotis]